MGRSADYTIQGFLYQFNKTILEILAAADGSLIIVEGIIEDIEVAGIDVTTAIQCKYHEAKEKYTLGALYDPLLQMMIHFHTTASDKVNYVLFAHFPNTDEITISKSDLTAALNTKNKDLAKFVAVLKDKVDLDRFLTKISIEVGPSFDDLVSKVQKQFAALGINKTDIETLWYPNALNLIGRLSVKHDVALRQIAKADFIGQLKQIKATAISHWTLSLKTRDKLLKARKNQLQTNLSINTRLRYFLLHADALDDFDNQIVLFIKSYLEKYHHKPAHVNTPVFCLDVSNDVFRAIELRLIAKDILLNDGIVAGVFNEMLFFRNPISCKDRREFALRIINWNENGQVLDKIRPDDLFVFGSGGYIGLESLDIAVEELEMRSFNDILFVMGLSNVID